MNQAEAEQTSSPTAHDGPITQFEDLASLNMVHKNVINEITQGMKHHTMTEVQTATINQALQGDDMYVPSDATPTHVLIQSQRRASKNWYRENLRLPPAHNSKYFEKTPRIGHPKAVL